MPTTVTGADTTTGALIVGSAAPPTNGVYLPASNTVGVATNGTGRLFIDSSGRLGIGTSSPSAPLTFAGTTGRKVGFYQGTEGYSIGVESSEFRFVTDAAGIFTFRNGGTYSSSTEYMRLDASGRLGIGTTPATPLQVLNPDSSTNTISMICNASNVARLAYTQNGSTTLAYSSIEGDGRSTGYLAFRTNDQERGRWDSSGRFLVGTSTGNGLFNGGTQNPQFQIEGTTGNTILASLTANRNDAAGPTFYLAHSRGTAAGGTTVLQSGDQCGILAFAGTDGTDYVTAASITAAVDGTPGADDMPGRLVFSTTADGASSPTERMRINNAGDIAIGKTDFTTGTAGVNLNREGSGWFSLNGVGVQVNRITTDGDLVYFRQDNTVEGTISVSGTTISYNGAHLSRWSQIPGIDPYDKTVRPEILRGTVMSNLDEMCDWVCPASGDCQDNEQLNKTKVSDVEGDKNVAGVFQGWDDDDDTWVNDYYLAMTGDFVIRIAAGVTVERGDLLMSAGDGTAKPQADDAVRSCTVAKVTSTTVSCTHPDGSYCVPCVLMAC